LTLFSDERIEEFSEKQKFGSINLHMPRGLISDRNMNDLAVSISLRSIYANPRKIKNYHAVAKTLAGKIEPKSKIRRDKLRKKLEKRFNKSREKYFVWVKRKVAPETYISVKAASITGVGFVKESRRFYPKRDIAAKIIGFCGIDNQGLYGLEYRYDQIIHPVETKTIVRKDARGRPISMPANFDIATSLKPYDLALTIDERIQYISEKALERRVMTTGAKGGVVIVMNPHTGEILAMAEQPKFNPNNYSSYKSGSWKPLGVSQSVEPGSTFKLFVAAAALEEKMVTPNETINCENGRYEVGGKYFKEAQNHRFNKLALWEVIAKSSNIGAIKVAEKLGPETLYKHLRSFGFGELTNIDLPGESKGLLRPTSKWSLTSLPSISFGQEVAVTPIQLATGISAFANGGYLVRPRLVKALMRDGKVVKTIKTEIVRRPLSESTANSITDMMIQVVRNGTGKKGAVPGFTVAGKTGTAQKIDPVTRTYSEDKFLSSFVGFLPAHNPRLVILVMIDEPVGVVWGGSVAGPVFAEVASRSARILRIPGAGNEIYEIDWSRMLKGRSGKGKSGKQDHQRTEKTKTGESPGDLVDLFRGVIESVKQFI